MSLEKCPGDPKWIVVEPSDEEGCSSSLPRPAATSATPAAAASPPSASTLGTAREFYEDAYEQSMELFLDTNPETSEANRAKAAEETASEALMAEAARLYDEGVDFSQLSQDWGIAVRTAADVFNQRKALGQEDPFQLRSEFRELPAVSNKRAARGPAEIDYSAVREGSPAKPPTTTSRKAQGLAESTKAAPPASSTTGGRTSKETDPTENCVGFLKGASKEPSVRTYATSDPQHTVEELNRWQLLVKKIQDRRAWSIKATAHKHAKNMPKNLDGPPTGLGRHLGRWSFRQIRYAW